jgi:hypothetical protein
VKLSEKVLFYRFCNVIRSFAIGARHSIVITTLVGMVGFVLNLCPSSVLKCVSKVQVTVKYLIKFLHNQHIAHKCN